MLRVMLVDEKPERSSQLGHAAEGKVFAKLPPAALLARAAKESLDAK